jgi:hypothetical protein
MHEVTGKQPWYVPLVLWTGPVLWAVVLAFLNFNSYRVYGRIYFHPEDWILHGLGILFLAVPLFLPYRQVTAVPDRIVARHYLGRSVAVPWHEIRKVEIVSFGLPEVQSRTLNLIPCNGRKISFSSQISNFEALLDTVLDRTVAPIVRRRPGS